jgi:ribonuclease HII
MVVKSATFDFLRTQNAQGYTHIVGCDEVGRGSIAGPVVIGMAYIPDESLWPENITITDSKLLTEKKRLLALEYIQKNFVTSVGISTPQEIELVGINPAQNIAAQRAYYHLKKQLNARGIEPDLIVLDGIHDWITQNMYGRFPFSPVVTEKKADITCAPVSVASIVAKVFRDTYMTDLSLVHTKYAWESNKGYGSQKHRDGIDLAGMTPQHRISWVTQN